MWYISVLSLFLFVAVTHSEIVRVLGTRNFLLWKKYYRKFEEEEKVMNNPPTQQQQDHLKGNLWKSWWKNFGISSHWMNLYTNSLLPHATRMVINFMAIVSTFIEPCYIFIGLFIVEEHLNMLLHGRH